MYIEWGWVTSAYALQHKFVRSPEEVLSHLKCNSAEMQQQAAWQHVAGCFIVMIRSEIAAGPGQSVPLRPFSWRSQCAVCASGAEHRRWLSRFNSTSIIMGTCVEGQS